MIKHYLYIEIIKILRSKYFKVNIILLFGLIAILLLEFINTVFTDFQVHLIYFPQSSFDFFFLDKLSSRMNLWLYVTTSSITLLSIELDTQNSFISKKIKIIPMNISNYVISKVLIIGLLITVISGILHITVSYLIDDYFMSKGFTLEIKIPITLFFNWLKQSFFIIATIIFIFSFALYTQYNLLLTFFLLLIFYFLGSLSIYFYPFSIFHYMTLSKQDTINFFDIIIAVFCSILFYFITYTKIKK